MARSDLLACLLQSDVDVPIFTWNLMEKVTVGRALPFKATASRCVAYCALHGPMRIVEHMLNSDWNELHEAYSTYRDLPDVTDFHK